MDKPISLIIEDAKKNIVDCINEQDLHPSILEPIIKDIYEQVRISAIQTYQSEKRAWEEKDKDKTDEFFGKEEE